MGRRPLGYPNYWILLTLVCISFPVEVLSGEIIGKPIITDGDSIRIDQLRIRLHGIDAPETKQLCRRADSLEYRCGILATLKLTDLIGDHWVTCNQISIDRYKRIVAVCYAGSVNINAEMVRAGWALAYRRYSKEYIEEEVDARLAKRGIWEGQFTKPWEWRKK